MMRTYDAEAAVQIVEAYNDEQIDSSLDLQLYAPLAGLLPPGRELAREAYSQYSFEAARDLRADTLQAFLIVGGMAVGKSTLIASLGSEKFYKPTNYRHFLPEYAAIQQAGRGIAAQRNRHVSHEIADQAGYFIKDERALLKAEAIRVAAEVGCSIAIECHPRLQEVAMLADVAEAEGLQTMVIGIEAGAGWQPLRRAVERSRQQNRPLSMRHLAETHRAMSDQWEIIAARVHNAVKVTIDESHLPTLDAYVR